MCTNTTHEWNNKADRTGNGSWSSAWRQKKARALHGDILLVFGLEQHTIGSQDYLQVSRLSRAKKFSTKLDKRRRFKTRTDSYWRKRPAFAKNNASTCADGEQGRPHANIESHLSFSQPASPSV